MHLEVQPGAAVQKLYQELRLGAVLLYVSRPQKVFRILRQ